MKKKKTYEEAGGNTEGIKKEKKKIKRVKMHISTNHKVRRGKKYKKSKIEFSDMKTEQKDEYNDLDRKIPPPPKDFMITTPSGRKYRPKEIVDNIRVGIKDFMKFGF